MEGDWYILKGIDLLGLVVAFHVHEQGFLIAQMPVVLKMIMQHKG